MIPFFATYYKYTPSEVRSLTITELISLSVQIISRYMIESNRHIFVPTMSEKANKIVKDQHKQIEERAKEMWDQMYPQVKRNNDIEFPDDYPDEYKDKIMKDNKLREKYGL